MEKTIVFNNNIFPILKNSICLQSDRNKVPLIIKEIIHIHDQQNCKDNFTKTLKNTRYCPRKFAVPSGKYVKYIYEKNGQLKITSRIFKVNYDDGETINVLIKSKKRIYSINLKKKDIYTFVHIDNDDILRESILKVT